MIGAPVSAREPSAPVPEAPDRAAAGGGGARRGAAAPDAERQAAPATLAAPLDPAGTLALQRAAGNAAVGRLLARRHPDLIDPFADEAPVDVAATRAALFQALDRSDALGFLSRLRALGRAEREALQADPAFQARMRRQFRGMARWSIELTLEFGATKPHDVNALSAAVHGADRRRVRTLLMAYPRLKRIPGIREAVASQFTGRDLQDLQAVLAEPDGARAEAADVGGQRAHYEDGELVVYPGGGAFELVRMSTHVRVIVRIRLYNDRRNEVNAVTDEAVARFERGIARYWNGKFRLRNGARTLDIFYLPVFVYHDRNAHHDVRMLPGDERSAMRRWYEGDSEDTAAHEFGHMLGNPDEYNLAGTLAELASLGLSDEEKRRSSWEGLFGVARPVSTKGYDVEGLMGSHESNRDVQVRHAFHVTQVFNARLRRPGESPWVVEKR
jgi:hypothetical protein